MSPTKPSIIFCSTSLAMYDRRMIRITEAISGKGYKLKWISRQHNAAKESDSNVQYIFIKCFFNSGILFYLEYNFRLFIKLLGSSEDCISCVDLDTLLAATIASKLKRKKLIFDAHEIFYEVPELTGKPFKKWIWKQVARWCIPLTDLRYTVNISLKQHYQEHYNKEFHVIRNVPDVAPTKTEAKSNNKVMVYLGAVNKGRGVEIAIRALQTLTEHRLVIIGEGDEYHQMRDLAVALDVKDRVDFRGYTAPDKIFSILQECSIGLNVLVAESENYRLSLANKFFDYMHAGLPSINMRYPEYESILTEHKVGIMIEDYQVEDLVGSVKKLDDSDFYLHLSRNCSVCKEQYTWDREKEVLLSVYDLRRS
jgi:glycosyltransferase involved in cell wall biosynthesis